jgi:formate-dependent nitrite reductase membrane component NrfD
MKDALLESVSGRHNPLIDPSLAIWGWEIPVYLFLGGLAAGLLVLTALFLLRGERPRSKALRLAPFTALVLISLGMLALFLDLEHKWYVWRFFLAFKPLSPMSWGSWILVLVYPVGALLGLAALEPGERQWLRCRLTGGRMPLFAAQFEALWAWLDRARTGLAWAAIGAGVGLGVYTGLLLGTLAARPQWNSAALGPLFLSSGLSTGAALLLLFRLDDSDRHTLVRWDVLAIVAELAFLGLMLLGFLAGDRTAQHAAYHLTGGPWASAFWSLVVIAGLAVPLVLDGLELRRKLPFSRLAPLLVLIGGLSLRFVLLVAGQASSFREFP